MNMNVAPELRAAIRPLQGRVAVVTGSTSGIGLGIARALAAEGASIVLNGFGQRDDIKATVDDLAQGYGVPVMHSDADMSDAGSIETMIASTLLAWGSVDILVNNAGIQHVAPLESFPPEKWNAILAINLSSAFHTMRLVLPGSRQGRPKTSAHSRRFSRVSSSRFLGRRCSSFQICRPCSPASL